MTEKSHRRSKAGDYVWILGDQLLAQHPALEAARQATVAPRVLMIESAGRIRGLDAKLSENPAEGYQRKKLVLLLSAMRHYADELRQRGIEVEYVKADSYAEALDRLGDATVWTMAASGRGCQRLQRRRGMRIVPNTQFLCERQPPYPDADPERRYTMEFFYRKMRKSFGLLLDERGEPVGGKWNYDVENRKPLPRGLEIPPPPSFEPDAMTSAVMEEVAAMPGVGRVDGFDLAVTRIDAERAFDHFVRHRLALFGPYEDAMSREDGVLYHSMLSPYLNIGLLEPLPLAQAAERAYREGKIPLSSAEGFIRQVVGWREYIWWQYWRLDERASAHNGFGAQRGLPAWFWSGATGMSCLRHVIERALDRGYTHHIERLMIVSNFCVLTGIAPKAVYDWFLSLYVDAYEWVMVPNVFGMGLHADGGLTATKPYISSGAYINRMSDFCKGCHYDVKARTEDRACPYNSLYWDFLMRHQKTLASNTRMQPMMGNLARLSEEDRQALARRASELLQTLDTL